MTVDGGSLYSNSYFARRIVGLEITVDLGLFSREFLMNVRRHAADAAAGRFKLRTEALLIPNPGCAGLPSSNNI